MRFPLTHDGDGAFIYPTAEIDEIAAVIRVILTILPGQHPRLPDFGNHAALLVFRNAGPGLEEQIAALVKFDIETWEPRARVEEVSVLFDETSAAYRVGIIYSSKLSPAERQEMTITLGA